jgi:hypothetical protein
MNILLFSSSCKGSKYLLNIHRKLVERNHNSFFLYTEHPTVCFDITKYSYDYKEEVDLSSGHLSKSLFGIHLPFKPDYVIIERERWQPEQNVIKEFKEVFNSKVILIEVNTYLLSVYECAMEYHSRNQYPQNMCDIYFEHSRSSLQKRTQASFKNSDKSIIVGNPKYDNLMDFKPTDKIISHFNEKYSFDSRKKKILWYSSMGLGRNKCLAGLQQFAKKYGNKYDILYKPYPGEPLLPYYKHQFTWVNDDVGYEFKDFSGVKLVSEDDTDMFYLAHLSDIHIGNIATIMYFPLILNKKVVNINNLSNYEKKGTNLDTLFERNEDVASGETGRACDFWRRVFNLNSDEELINLIGIDRMEKFKEDNIELRDIFSRNTIDWDDDYEFLDKDIPDNTELLNLFDDFNDFSASKRIVKYLEDNEDNNINR